MEFIQNLFTGMDWKGLFMTFGVWVGYMFLIQVSTMMISGFILLAKGVTDNLSGLIVVFSLTWATYLVIV